MFMNPNKMTGDPNQQNTHFFGYTNFPSTSSVPFVGNVQPPSPFASFPPPQLSQPFVHNSPIAIGSFNFGTDRTLIQQQPVQFPFTVEDGKFSNLRCKRKTDSPPLQQCKQHITEEKMAEHMSNLHISSETVIKSEPEQDRNKRLYMCEEMRKLQTDSILPQCLLNRLHKPCTALVLWQPPSPIIRGPANQFNDTSENNNSEDEPDNNKMDNDVIYEVDNLNFMEMDK